MCCDGVAVEYLQKLVNELQLDLLSQYYCDKRC